MDELGELLKRTREERKISLDELENGTKIRKTYLLAIERGDYSSIPGEVYLKGFIRNYADYIGLDGLEIIKRYNAMKSASENSESPDNHEVSEEYSHRSVEYPPQYIEGVGKRRRVTGKRNEVSIILFLVILLVVIFLYMLLINEGVSNLPPPSSKPTAADVSTRDASDGNASAVASEEYTHSVDVSDDGPLVDAFAENRSSGDEDRARSDWDSDTGYLIRQRDMEKELHRVDAVMTDNCWLKVSIGGEGYLERLFREGERLSIISKDDILLRIGNAAGITLDYNGEHQGDIGEPFQVVEVGYPGGNKRIIDLNNESEER